MKNHKEILRQKVLKHGWEFMSEMIGGFDILYKHAFNNDYNEFLNLFNNLEVVPSEQNSEFILYRFEKGNNVLIYDAKFKQVHFSYNVIWSFFEGLKHEKIQDIMEKWLDGVYNLSRINPVSSPEIEYSRWVWSAT